MDSAHFIKVLLPSGSGGKWLVLNGLLRLIGVHASQNNQQHTRPEELRTLFNEQWPHTELAPPRHAAFHSST